MINDILNYSCSSMNEPNEKSTSEIMVFDIFLNNRTERNIKKELKNACRSCNKPLIEYLVNNFKTNNIISNNGLYYASSFNNIELVEYFIRLNNNTPMTSGVVGACKGGHLELVKMFSEKGEMGYGNCVYYAARFNHRHILDYFQSEGIQYYSYGMNGAAHGGDIELVEFFMNKGSRNYKEAMYYASINGDFNLVKFFAEKCSGNYNTTCLYGAIKNNNLDMVNFFVENGSSIQVGLDLATFFDNIDMMDYFIQKGADDWDSALINAAHGGHPHLVQYCIERGASAPYDNALEFAIIDSNYEIIEILTLYNGCDLNTALLCAVEHNMIDLVIFFIERGADNFEEAYDLAYKIHNKKIAYFIEEFM